LLFGLGIHAIYVREHRSALFTFFGILAGIFFLFFFSIFASAFLVIAGCTMRQKITSLKMHFNWRDRPGATGFAFFKDLSKKARAFLPGPIFKIFWIRV